MGENSLAMMPWFPRDFLAATIGWRLLERALYRCFLDAQWELGALPPDEEELARIAGATPEEFALAWPRVKTKFRSTASGLLQNDTLEQHRRKALEIRDKKRRAGRKGGLASGESRSTASVLLEPEPQAQTTISASPSASSTREANTKPPSPSPSLSSPRSLALSQDPSVRAPKRRKRSPFPTRICPPDWELTNELREWANHYAPSIDVERETAAFREFEFARAWKHWDAVWRRWITKAKPNGQTKPKLTWRPDPADDPPLEPLAQASRDA